MIQLKSLIDHEIPLARQSLLENHKNLEKVAVYCETSYFQTDDKSLALKETKEYTTQSLASVVSQINTLAYKLIHLLDLQSDQLTEMESQINHISQSISIHKEKVARREIGVLTANKCVNNQHKILVPANPEKAVKYTRKPIDYSILDDIGHGVKIPVNVTRTKRLGSSSGIYGETGISGTAPTSKPPNPPQTLSRHTGHMLGTGTLSRGSKEYRTPVPVVAPPQVPSNYAANYPQGHPRANDYRRGSGYSTLPMYMTHQGGQVTSSMQQQMMKHSQNNQQPQVGMVHPITQINNNFIPPSPTPPPPPPPPQTDIGCSPVSDSLPPPPFHQQISHNNTSINNESIDRTAGAISPPLPSPPAMDEPIYNHGAPPNNTDWIPKQYIEKVIAIYDYSANRNDELSFQENSVIYVIKKNDDGWYEGVMEGITGLFPGNYVEPCR